MTDPPRLRDDPGAPPALRSDLEHASQHALPFDVGAGLARLEASIVAPVTPTSSAAKVLGSAAAVGAIAIAVWLVARSPDEPPSMHTAPLPTPVLADAAIPDAAIPDAAIPGAEVIAVADAALPARSPRRELAPANDTRREIAHMARLRQVAARDPAEALALAEEGHREFPRGLFREEREANAILALEALGRHDLASRRGARFLRTYPASAFAERISAIVESH